MNQINNPNELMHNLPLAEERIAKQEKNFYGIKSISDLVLHEQDFFSAMELEEKENKLVLQGDGAINKEGLIRGIAYCVLTPRQKYPELIQAFSSLLDGNGNIQKFSSQKEITDLLGESRIVHANQKAGYIYQSLSKDYFALLLNILASVNTTRKNEVLLRDQLCEEVTGIGLKTGSLLLRMCGAKELVPIDSWIMEMLFFHGYDCKMPRTKVIRPAWGKENVFSNKFKKSSLDKEQYLRAENFALDLAKKYGVSGHLLHSAFYAKKSSYGK